jgi:hypothetical protein
MTGIDKILPTINTMKVDGWINIKHKRKET